MGIGTLSLGIFVFLMSTKYLRDGDAFNITVTTGDMFSVIVTIGDAFDVVMTIADLLFCDPLGSSVTWLSR